MNRLQALAGTLRTLTLLVFATFFAGPLLWLLLAPTRTDYQLATGRSFAFGSLANVARAWSQLDGFGDHLFRRWMENSILYAFTATALTLVTAIPAGYGLATGRFRGRTLVLTDMLLGVPKPQLALAALIATLPLALVFVASQRVIVRGLPAGSSTG